MPAGPAPALKPGVIALRPLLLSDIFNGAVAYIRLNPKATLGLTTIVVVAAQLVSLILQIVGPLASTGNLNRSLRGEDMSTAALVGSSASSIAAGIAIGFSAILLSGLLTVVVGRAVFGAGITMNEAWERLRARLLALIGFTALEALGAVVIVGVITALIVLIAYTAGGVAAFLIGAPLAIAGIALLAYLGTMLVFAPPAIVLERLGVVAAVGRSFALVRNDFWRVFGIRLLAVIVAGVISTAVSVPFNIAGQILAAATGAMTLGLVAIVLMTVGTAIGQIVTAPFSAGVVVLLYTDRRIRAEAFDLVLRTGATGAPQGRQDSTDHLWLIRRP